MTETEEAFKCVKCFEHWLRKQNYFCIAGQKVKAAVQLLVLVQVLGLRGVFLPEYVRGKKVLLSLYRLVGVKRVLLPQYSFRD